MSTRSTRPSRKRRTSRQADADLLPHDYRQGRADQGRAATTRTARRSAPRKSPTRARRSAGRCEPFVIPQEVYAAWDAKEAGRARRSRLEQGVRRVPREASGASRRIRAPHERRTAGELGAGREADHRGRERRRPKPSPRARLRSRRSTALAAALPELLGGSADLTGSNLTNWKASKPVRAGDEHERRSSGATTSTTACANSA